ncbi:endochitinase A isoform X1 [Daphnia magna]|uniref:endochitinase A isoform X1 n=1 Tax=Daphnia magna TaxID=35525 RepID=UPI001E1BA1C1|nr:endochitinase A isoform X1 [Daphnia magna]
MKLALVFLMALVVISQQFYLRQPYSRTFWLSPYPPQDFLSHYQPLVMPIPENLDTVSKDIQNDTNEFPDTQSRIRGFGNKKSSSSNNEPAQRFLLGASFGNNGYTGNGNVRYPFLNTYTTTTTSTSTVVTLSTSTVMSTSTTSTTSTSTAVITTTATLSLTSVVKCVPQFQVAAGAGPCGRKKRSTEDFENEPQFAINPSATLKVTPTALPSESTQLREIRELGLPSDEHQVVGSLRSSKTEVYLDEAPEEEQKTIREKRFFLANRNYFFTSTSTTTSTSTLVVPVTSVIQSITTLTAFATTTVSSFLFANSTITQTINLITPVPVAQCVPAAAVPAAGAVAAVPAINCLSCLPTGFVVCAVAG